MKLFEAILDANHRAVDGDQSAAVHVGQFEDELPVVALTCIDSRLNALFPAVLGLPGDQFIWLRNAGNIITGPLSSTMRSLSLACAVKGGKEIAIIGHTDCLVGKTTTMQLIDKLRAVGVERQSLPENLNEYFGIFASERLNVIAATDLARRSPLVGAKVPVHGLMVDVSTGRLEWLVNGYQVMETTSSATAATRARGSACDGMKALGSFDIGEMKFPESKIGDSATKVGGAASVLGDSAAQIGEGGGASQDLPAEHARGTNKAVGPPSAMPQATP